MDLSGILIPTLSVGNIYHLIFFSHIINIFLILGTDGLPWTCLEYVKLNETDTTSSSRIFIKVLVQELSETLGDMSSVCVSACGRVGVCVCVHLFVCVCVCMCVYV